ncbi:DUF2812 domain-containing protein [Terrisporobacter hibernicus]|uniref:DUF2812 domain-containing protein n=1 Tax=Terrisporobacter hibernicus TaxID=2813371 RepID=A0AAX2ZDG6_9FIRM|nr:DUF2812 domain-containing protein [Terrisporobacter hibernicus]UEL47061.1 DUF2812 domain-containing protein [Terrisporobacter hibernicus]
MHKTRVFFDIEKETNWLNNLSKEGYRLTNKSWFTYYFENCDKEKYIYQIERRKPFSSKENEDYINFVSSLNINTVSTQWGWFYFEKENDGKEFTIFSDIPSKIAHYRNLIITVLIIAFFSFSIFNNCLNSPVGSQGPYVFNLSVPLVGNSIIIFASITTAIKYILKIHMLKKENSVVE